MTVSIISSGAGSVAVSARPAFANTCGHTGFTDGERNASEILKRLQVARCPDHVLRLAQLDNGAARLLVRALHRIDHLAVWNVVGTQSIWIENDLVLPNHAADARHFGDIRHCLELVLEKPVLQGTKLRQIHASRAVDECILVDPADARRIRTERR